MCADEMPSIAAPEVTIRSDGIRAWVDPPLLRSGEVDLIRSLKVEIGPLGEPTRVTAELLPSSILLMLSNPVVGLVTDGQPVAAITLADGTVIQLG